jgi:hypothetical protein
MEKKLNISIQKIQVQTSVSEPSAIGTVATEIIYGYNLSVYEYSISLGLCESCKKSYKKINGVAVL